MSAKYFLDTNILVYSVDPSDRSKQRRASDLIRDALADGQGIISYQVIQEFCSLARRKFAKPFTWRDLGEFLEKVLVPLCEVQSSVALYRSCLGVAEQMGFSFYDSAIIAAAAQARCETLYTEDMNAGQVVSGVKIVNPFKT